MREFPPLPIDEVLPQVIAALSTGRSLVLRAATGAGKTTRVPGALLDAGVAPGQIVLVEPRRLAAQSAAARIATERGETLGEAVGYHVRFDRRAGRATRILAVTDGIFARRLQDDPFLEGISLVLFDEFHERRLESDLALAMALRVRETARDDLRIGVMSATLDPAPIAAMLGDAAVVESEGRLYPVETTYLRFPPARSIAETAAEGIEEVLSETDGDVLAFFPGVAEIRRAERLLAAAAQAGNLAVLPLFGEMPLAEQQRVLAPSTRRKIILATNVAETSLTIEGVTAVVDTGFARVTRQDASLGINRLDTIRVSKASAEQRRGRAGRTAPGICRRLWTEREHQGLAERESPEILRVDLAGMLLDLLAWGERDASSLAWLDPPKPAALAAARQLLERLGALAGEQVTALGREMAVLPLHPRLSRLVVEGKHRGVTAHAALAASMLAERDLFGGSRRSTAAYRAGSDVADRLARLNEGEADHRGAALVRRAASQIARSAGQPIDGDPAPRIGPREEEALRRAVLAAFPDRVARRREPGSRRALLVGGRGVRLDEGSCVSEAPLFVAVEIQEASGSEALVRQASAIEIDWLDPQWTTTNVEVEFDEAAGRVTAVKRTRYFDLAIDERPTGSAPAEEAAALLAHEAASRLSAAQLTDEQASRLFARVELLRCAMPELGLPATEGIAIETLAERSAGCTSFAQLLARPLAPIYEARLDGSQRAALERNAPERIEVPSGNRIAIDYAPPTPMLAVRIQEIFGWSETPRIAAGRVPLLLHLLGPNYRPQQITSDLASFWKNTYAQVRKELRRRYPKHAWPEDPTTAKAERRPQRRA